MGKKSIAVILFMILLVTNFQKAHIVSGEPPEIDYQMPFCGLTNIPCIHGGPDCEFHTGASNNAQDFTLKISEKNEYAPFYVLAAADGIVVTAGPSGCFGSTIRILHADGRISLYAHLQQNSLAVNPGDQVTQGQLLAISGNTTGDNDACPQNMINHLHFEIRQPPDSWSAQAPVGDLFSLWQENPDAGQSIDLTGMEGLLLGKRLANGSFSGDICSSGHAVVVTQTHEISVLFPLRNIAVRSDSPFKLMVDGKVILAAEKSGTSIQYSEILFIRPGHHQVELKYWVDAGRQGAVFAESPWPTKFVWASEGNEDPPTLVDARVEVEQWPELAAPQKPPTLTPEPPAPRQQLAFVQDENIYIGTVEGAPPIQVTSDGKSFLVTGDTSTSRISYEQNPDSIQWSPNRKYLSFVRTLDEEKPGEGTNKVKELIVYDTTTGTQRTVLRENFHGYDWAEDNQHIVFGRKTSYGYLQGSEKLFEDPIYGIWKLDILTEQMEEFVEPGGSYPLGYPRYDADYSHLFFRQIINIEGTLPLAVYNIAADKFIQIDGIDALDWSGYFDLFPLRDQIAYDKRIYEVAPGTTIHIADYDKNNDVVIMPPLNDYFCLDPKFSPDGGKLAFIRGSFLGLGNPGLVYIYDFSLDQVYPIFNLPTSFGFSYKWTSDSEKIIYQATYGDCPLIMDIASSMIEDYPYCGSLPVYAP